MRSKFIFFPMFFIMISYDMILCPSRPCNPLLPLNLFPHFLISSPEQALVNRVQEAFKVSPSVIYLPNLTSWYVDLYNTATPQYLSSTRKF